MPDPKQKKSKPQYSRDPEDIRKSVERDYPNYTARYVGQTAGDRAEFRMRGRKNGGTFTLNRAVAFPGVAKAESEKTKKKSIK
jgi:hypothetical protein